MRFTLALASMCHSVDRWLLGRVLQLAELNVDNLLYHRCVLDWSYIDLFPQCILKLAEPSVRL